MSKMKFVPRWIRSKWYFWLVMLVEFVLAVFIFTKATESFESGSESLGIILIGLFAGICIGMGRSINKRRIYRKQGYQSKRGLLESREVG